ncbi:hypothetical protein CYMTET_44025 [Cymbomonas tetramitiformis]|uniref:Uncharacterized protein n=1 Tax=Cymbomonas tetramitiformis TaxID=36881 RepID=A0AAE0C2A9_9CHLO|nr:hypothetical protein CYMTET_44025 [Cymbomonas tetramitiformis]
MHPAVVLLDCWPVQLKDTFRARVKGGWPWIILLYIPPGCTGRGQKADVDGGGVLKPKLRARTTQYLQKEYSQQLREGKAPHEVALDLSLGNMKVRQLYWIGEVFMEFKANIEARTKGWGLTGVPRVFSEEMQRAARELHLKGLLFPNGRVEFTPQSTGAEETPGADTDDYEPQLEDFVEGEDQGAAADYRCAEQYTELGAAEIVLSRAAKRGAKRKAAAVENEAPHVGIEDLTAGTIGFGSGGVGSNQQTAANIVIAMDTANMTGVVNKEGIVTADDAMPSDVKVEAPKGFSRFHVKQREPGGHGQIRGWEYYQIGRGSVHDSNIPEEVVEHLEGRIADIVDKDNGDSKNAPAVEPQLKKSRQLRKQEHVACGTRGWTGVTYLSA